MAGEPSGDLAVRVLFAGACQGQFGKLLKKVEKVNVKNGPFDALFCVGQFFNEEGTNNDGEFIRFLDSGQKMPITTYILGAYGVGYKEAKEKLQQVDCNVHLMGKRGILTLQNGLRVAYLEGTYDADVSSRMEEDNAEGQYYSTEDVIFLRNLAQSQPGDIDFFLSCEWPANITSRLTTNSVEGPVPQGCQYISSLLPVIRPRYHFTSQPPLFFSRPPYKNPDLGAGSHVTRFTSLCPFGSGKKQNLFALCLTPAQHMNHEKLLEIPYDATEFPFDLEERKRDFNPNVKIDVTSAGDSSCTSPEFGPQLTNNISATQTSNIAHSFQPSFQFYGNQASNLQETTRSQSAVQMLMQNIGRSNVMTGSNDLNAGLLRSQGSYGGKNPIQSNLNSFQAQIPMLSQSSLPGNYSNLHQYPIPGSYVPVQQTGQFQAPLNVQNLVATLSKNPQLLSTALSMGLLPQNLMETVLTSIQANQTQASMNATQGTSTLRQDFGTLPTSNPHLDKTSEINVPCSPLFSSVNTLQVDN